MAAAADTALLALVEGADDATLARIAERLRPWLAPVDVEEPDRWMDTGEAACYLGMSRNALHKLTARRGSNGVPFEQEAPRGKCWFRRSDLDRWRRGGTA